MHAPDVLARLDGLRKCGDGWLARCPAHDDRTPSLSIRETTDGRVLLHCFAGCSFPEIARALHVRTSADSHEPRRQGIEAHEIGATYRHFLRRARERRPRWERHLPLRASERQWARTKTCAHLGVALPQVEIPDFERFGAPVWETDPLWPLWYRHVLAHVVLERWHQRHPDAEPGATDPDGPTDDDRRLASVRTADEMSAACRIAPMPASSAIDVTGVGRRPTLS
jgi:hypothetical protein